MSLQFPSLHFTKSAINAFQSKKIDGYLSCALFLRLSTEARLAQYKNHRGELAKQKISGHKIKHMKMELDRLFKTKGKVVEIDTGDSKLYFTPVSDRQVHLCSLLGNWLHYGEKYYEKREAFVEELLPYLTELLELSITCNLGAMLGPPVFRMEGEAVHFSVQFDVTDEDVAYIGESPTERENIIIPYKPTHFKYGLLDELPEAYRKQKMDIYFGNWNSEVGF